MRVIVALISVLFAATIAPAQAPAALAPPSPVEIVKYNWSKERLDWDKNPFGSRTEISDMRSRRGSILHDPFFCHSLITPR